MKRFNLNEFLWFLVLVAFSILMFYLLNTGKIRVFVHPKMIKYMTFSFFGFVILAVHQFKKTFTVKSRRPISKIYIVFFLVVASAFYSAEKGINLSIADNKGISVTSGVKNNSTQKVDAGTQSPNNSAGNYLKDSFKQSSRAQDTIIFDENNYYGLLYELGENYEAYKGKKVILTGFVYKQEDFKEKEFVIGRLLVSCCTADSQLVGLIAEWEEALSLEKEQWVSVEGILEVGNFTDSVTGESYDMPKVKVGKLEKIAQPKDHLIYP